MGINGFLRAVNTAMEQTHLSKYEGQVIAIDALSWLHKACYGCALDLGLGNPTDSYVQYMLRRVELVRMHGIADVILVFDGSQLPMKANTHSKRHETKKNNMLLARQHYALSKNLRNEARDTALNQAIQYFQRSISITTDIIENVMKELRKANIKFVVAPYEADAQLVSLCNSGIASAILTEDSDVFVYIMTSNCSAPVLYKLNDTGSVQALSRQILHEKSKDSSDSFLRKIHYLTTGEKEATRMFVQVCALAGCDFIDSLPGMGIITALNHIFAFRGVPGHLRIPRLLVKLASKKGKSKSKSKDELIPTDYKARFSMTEGVFYHHLVFDAIDIIDSLGIKSTYADETVNLHTSSTKTSDFLGKVLSQCEHLQNYNSELKITRNRSNKLILDNVGNDKNIPLSNFTLNKRAKVTIKQIERRDQLEKDPMRERERLRTITSISQFYSTKPSKMPSLLVAGTELPNLSRHQITIEEKESVPANVKDPRSYHGHTASGNIHNSSTSHPINAINDELSTPHELIKNNDKISNIRTCIDLSASDGLVNTKKRKKSASTLYDYFRKL